MPASRGTNLNPSPNPHRSPNREPAILNGTADSARVRPTERAAGGALHREQRTPHTASMRAPLECWRCGGGGLRRVRCAVCCPLGVKRVWARATCWGDGEAAVSLGCPRPPARCVPLEIGCLDTGAGGGGGWGGAGGSVRGYGGAAVAELPSLQVAAAAEAGAGEASGAGARRARRATGRIDNSFIEIGRTDIINTN